MPEYPWAPSPVMVPGYAQSGTSVTFTDDGAWVTATAYVVGDIVTQSGKRYIAATAHTSGTFATDLAAAKWVQVGGAAQSHYAVVATQETTTSTSYTDLATVGPEVTHVVPASGEVKVTIRCGASNGNSNAYAFASVALSGGNTVAASDDFCWSNRDDGTTSYIETAQVLVLTGLTPGSTTFTMKYKVNAGTGTYYRRAILVEDLDLA